MKIRPLNDRILIKRVEEEEKTKGGIIIPDSAKEKPVEGIVVAVGNGKYNDKGERIVSRQVIGCCSANTAGQMLNWKVKIILSCGKMIFWPLLRGNVCSNYNNELQFSFYFYNAYIKGEG